MEEAFQTYRISARLLQADIPHSSRQFSYESINRLRYGEIEQALECRRKA